MKRTKEESLETREKIIEAALYIFLEKGFSKTSVEDIVSSLNLTRGAFYWHFKDKDELFKSIIEIEHNQRTASMNSILELNLDDRERLEKLMINILEHFYDNDRFRNFIKLRWFRVEQDPYKFSVPATVLMNETTISIIMNSLNSAKEKGLLKENINIEEATYHLIALTNGTYRLYFAELEFYKSKTNTINMIKNYIDLIFL